MTSINSIREQYSSAVIRKCRERNCELKTGDLKNCVILDGEKVSQRGKRCDCIIFIKDYDIFIGLVELKSRDIHATEIKKKFDNSVRITLGIIKTVNSIRKRRNFFFILLHKGINAIERKKLVEEKITVNGEQKDIIVKRCGTSFSDILHKFS